MAAVKFTMQRGKTALKDVAVSAGTAEAVSDTVSINIDYAKMTRGDVIVAIEGLEQKILAGTWPPL